MTTKQKVNPYLSLLEIPPSFLNLTGYINSSSTNNPNSVAVISLQGTLRECPGYFQPESWSFEINQLMSIEQIVQKIISNPQNKRVIFSGGEPFWQAPALTEVAKKVKAAGLEVIAFTGFSLAELQSPYAPAKSRELLNNIDILKFQDGSSLVCNDLK